MKIIEALILSAFVCLLGVLTWAAVSMGRQASCLERAERLPRHTQAQLDRRVREELVCFGVGKDE